MPQSNNPLTKIDLLIFIPLMVLLVSGVLFIFSSGVSSSGVVISNEYLKQIIWVALGLLLLLLFSSFKYEYYRDFAMPIFIALLLIVLITSFVGKTVNGAKNWLGVGEFGVQPSEFLKIATIISFSLLIERWSSRLASLKYFLLAIGFMLLPIGVVFIQQDLGTALVFFPIFLFIIMVGGASTRHIVYVLLFLAVMSIFIFLPFWNQYIVKEKIPLLAVFTERSLSLVVFGTIGLVALLGLIGYLIFRRQYFYFTMYIASVPFFAFLFSSVARIVLKEYQMKRLLVFLDPYFDAKGAGWNIIQSLTAVGAGGVSGKGYLEGTQSHLGFLPEQSTDFIFSILSEEWGFMGAVVVFSCFLVICFRLLDIASKAKDQFGSNMAAGIAGMLFFHFMINVGMAIGVMPITGIPLVFVSYGGSSLMAAMWALGVAMNVNANRFQF